MKKFGINKNERLKSRKAIDALFKNGNSVFSYPLKLVYHCPETSINPIQFAVSVPKRKHKSAVKRNLLKRRIREAYRNNSLDLKNHIQEQDFFCQIMFIYIGSQIEEYDVIANAVKKNLQNLIAQLS